MENGIYGEVAKRYSQAARSSSVEKCRYLKSGGCGGASKALTKTYEPIVKNTLDRMRSTHVAAASRAFKSDASVT